MCTVTILPESLVSAVKADAEDPLRWRLVCNRDELTTRPAALPPAITRAGSRLAIMPVDPESGGTWIGVNDAGLVCSLLNVYNGSTATRARVSRGTIIPPLLRYADVDSALMWASQLEPVISSRSGSSSSMAASSSSAARTDTPCIIAGSHFTTR